MISSERIPTESPHGLEVEYFQYLSHCCVFLHNVKPRPPNVKPCLPAMCRFACFLLTEILCFLQLDVFNIHSPCLWLYSVHGASLFSFQWTFEFSMLFLWPLKQSCCEYPCPYVLLYLCESLSECTCRSGITECRVCLTQVSWKFCPKDSS